MLTDYMTVDMDVNQSAIFTRWAALTHVIEVSVATSGLGHPRRYAASPDTGGQQWIAEGVWWSVALAVPYHPPREERGEGTRPHRNLIPAAAAVRILRPSFLIERGVVDRTDDARKVRCARDRDCGGSSP